MNRREFAYLSGMAVVGLLLPKHEYYPTIVPTPAGFQDLHWIDFAEPVDHVVQWRDTFYVFTYRAVYRVVGCYGKTAHEPIPGGRSRVWFEEMIPGCAMVLTERI